MMLILFVSLHVGWGTGWIGMIGGGLYTRMLLIVIGEEIRMIRNIFQGFCAGPPIFHFRWNIYGII